MGLVLPNDRERRGCGRSGSGDIRARDRKAPRRMDEPLRPWLIRVAVNLSRDLLRRRRRQGYVGPWLPSPVHTDEDSPASYEPPAPSEDSPVARYDLKESISFAFLLALEALTPLSERCCCCAMCLIIRQTETAAALDMTPANVKVVLRAHAAR